MSPSKADIKAALARSFAAEMPAGLPLDEKARRIVDDLIRRDYVAESEREEWVRKTRRDLELGGA